MAPKFRVGQKVAKENECSVRYMVVLAIVDCGEWIEYHLSGYNYPAFEADLREPTHEELGTYF